jgi:hypothetical protein
MVRACVPEASVNEHSDLGSRKDDICLAPQPRDGTTVDVVSQSPCMKSTPERHLGRRVASSLPAHPVVKRVGRREGHAPRLRHGR